MLFLLEQNQQQRAWFPAVARGGTFALLMMQNQFGVPAVTPPVGGGGGGWRPAIEPRVQPRPVLTRAAGETVTSGYAETVRAHPAAAALALETRGRGETLRARLPGAIADTEAHAGTEGHRAITARAAGETETSGTTDAITARPAAATGETETAAHVAATQEQP